MTARINKNMEYSSTSVSVSNSSANNSGGSGNNHSQATKNISHYAQTLTYLLGELKLVFDQQNDSEVTRVAAYERLGEISKIMRIILEKYPLLKSKELLINASQLVQAVKTYDYKNYSIECHSKLVDNINALYRSFQFNISNCLVQDVISMDSSDQSSPSQSRMVQQQPSPTQQPHSTLQTSYGKAQSRTLPSNLPEERILAHESGVDELLKQAKAWSKYIKEIVTFIEKRAQIESEYNRSISKNAQNLRSSIHHLKSDKAFLPYNNVYNQFCQNEIKNANICSGNFDMLIKNILDPVNEYRIEFDKQTKKIKEDWTKENKQLNDALNNYSKSREIYRSKLYEAKKAKPKLSEGSVLEWNNDKLERLERDSRAAEAECTKYMMNYNQQKEIFKKSKRDIINRLQNLLTIIEIKIKEITSHYFETLRDSIIYSPEEIKKAINDTKCYETGKSYRDFANSLPFIFQQQESNNTNKSSHNLHLISSLETPEVDSSESESINTNLFIKQRKDQSTKSILTMNHSKHQQSVNEDFKMKIVEKNYQNCYGQYPVMSKNDSDGGGRKQHPFFGVALGLLSSNTVPDIIKQCVKQIELRGSRINGIYRVSAVKSQIENLCNAYEACPSSVDLTSASPNVIANFLKHFFRMLPEPLLTFQLYPDFIEIATKYSKNHSIDNAEEIVKNLKNVVQRLPTVHYNTLEFLMRHLKEISKDCNFNQMSPSNLGIVFGPTLMKKNDDDNTALLYDTNHQSRIVELLILYSDEVFDSQQDSSDNSIHRTNSFSSMDRFKSDVIDRQSTNGENHRMSNPLLKSATCSSFNPELSQFKHDINEAKLKFFASSVNSSQPKGFYYSSQNESSNSKMFKIDANNTMSPFSQIQAAGSTSQNSLNQMGRVRRFPGHFVATNDPQQKTSGSNIKIYNKHNELSKSSSDIYSYKNMNISITPSNNEDLV